jgi:hypothetical protein
MRLSVVLVMMSVAGKRQITTQRVLVTVTLSTAPLFLCRALSCNSTPQTRVDW